MMMGSSPSSWRCKRYADEGGSTRPFVPDLEACPHDELVRRIRTPKGRATLRWSPQRSRK